MTRPSRLLLTGALLCATSSTACSPGSATAPTAAPVLAQVSPLQQSRSDSDRRVATLPVRNDGRPSVRITSVQLESSRFAGLPAVTRDDAVPAGDRVDLRVPYGAARCEPGPPGEAVVVGVETAEGRAVSQRFALPPPVQGLDRAHEVDCLQQRYEQAFAPVLVGTGPPAVTAGRPTLPARLTFARRRSLETLVVLGLSGSRLYDLVPVAAATGDVLTLAGGPARGVSRRPAGAARVRRARAEPGQLGLCLLVLRPGGPRPGRDGPPPGDRGPEAAVGPAPTALRERRPPQVVGAAALPTNRSYTSAPATPPISGPNR